MIKKIVLAFMFIFMLIAFVLVGSGITQEELTADFMSFIKTISQRFRDVDWSIPNIPVIPKVDSSFVNVLIGIVNLLSGIVNALIFVLNFVIHFFTYIYAIISSFREVGVSLVVGL